MVCSKHADSNHDFGKDKIKPMIVEIDGCKVVMATGTTLGADNGLGLAAGMALVFDKTI